MTLFFSLLSVLALAAAVAVAFVAAGATRTSDTAVLTRIRDDLGPVALLLAAAVAVVATAGSLYYSQVAHFTPCELCWFQRICMYPLALLLAIAALRRDRAVVVYALPLAAIGAAISMYHYQLQRYPDQGGFCSLGAACTVKEVEQWRFVTIPFMAGSAFLLVLALLVVARRDPTPTSSTPSSSPHTRQEALLR